MWIVLDFQGAQLDMVAEIILLRVSTASLLSLALGLLRRLDSLTYLFTLLPIILTGISISAGFLAPSFGFFTSGKQLLRWIAGCLTWMVAVSLSLAHPLFSLLAALVHRYLR